MDIFKHSQQLLDQHKRQIQSGLDQVGGNRICTVEETRNPNYFSSKMFPPEVSFKFKEKSKPKPNQIDFLKKKKIS